MASLFLPVLTLAGAAVAAPELVSVLEAFDADSLDVEPELPRVDRVGAAARRPPFPAQRGPRVNADFSSTRAALGMARVRHKTRSPVAI